MKKSREIWKETKEKFNPEKILKKTKQKEQLKEGQEEIIL